MRTINLDQLTGGGAVHNLSGRLRGLAAREMFELDVVDGSEDDAELVVPSHVYSVTPSFVQGLLGESVRAVNNDLTIFRRKYRFVAPAIVLQQLERGLSAIITDRGFAGLQ